MTIVDEILRKTSVEVPEESDIFLRLGETISLPKYVCASFCNDAFPKGESRKK